MSFRSAVTLARRIRDGVRGRIRGQCVKRVFELLVAGFQGLGDDADLADDLHEIGVAVPPGDDVHVQVAGQACAGTTAQVDADVEALWVDGRGEQMLGQGGQVDQTGALWRGQIGELGYVFARSDQEVAVGVGVAVEHQDAALVLEQDEAVLGVGAVRVSGGGLAQEAGFALGGAFGLRRSGGGVGVELTDVIPSPGRPEVVVILMHVLRVGSGLRGLGGTWGLSYTRMAVMRIPTLAVRMDRRWGWGEVAPT